MEQAFLADEVLVVIVVEGGRSLEVKRCQVIVPVAGGARAIRLPCFSKGTIDVGVVVDASPEGCAPCLANRMCTYLT